MCARCGHFVAACFRNGHAELLHFKSVETYRIPKHNTHLICQRISSQKEILSWGSQAGNISQAPCSRSCCSSPRSRGPWSCSRPRRSGTPTARTPGNTGVCEQNTPFRRAFALQSSSKNRSPAPDLLFCQYNCTKGLLLWRNDLFADTSMSVGRRAG